MNNQEIFTRVQAITQEMVQSFIFNPNAHQLIAELNQIQKECPHEEVDEQGFCKFCKRGGCH